MQVLADETMPIQVETDIVVVRQRCRIRARESGLNLVDQTKLVTAASELARNALVHGGGGTCRIQQVREDHRTGVRLTFHDEGGGIKDPEQALSDGYTQTDGLGLGLGGARRLVDEFELTSEPSQGTTVTITRWQ
ncbi:MAG: anti-sigma regulatory factor [Planctomycetota bacterium]